MSDPLVSIVTPVYNCESYIRECIVSVQSQTYSHWNYTIVDNCSSDDTLKIALEMASQDSRIRVVRNTHFVRVIENHNISVREASDDSKYCKIIAADDWMFPECIEKLVSVAEKHPNVAVVASHGIFGNHVSYCGLPYPSEVVSGRELCRRYLIEELPFMNFAAPSSVLYRTADTKRRPNFFNESNLHADAELCFELLSQRDFGFVHQILVFNRLRPDSVTSHAISVNTFLSGQLQLLRVHGASFFSPEERAALSDRLMERYYRYLAAEVFRFRDRGFWKLHREKMEQLEMPLSDARLTLHAIMYLLSVICSKRTLKKMFRLA
jgi:glycosyltransferase involved in cell wall biosynthesis